ncbi:hypothetical protein V6N13_048472 [Hibiscus sabdariffa]
MQSKAQEGSNRLKADKSCTEAIPDQTLGSKTPSLPRQGSTDNTARRSAEQDLLSLSRHPLCYPVEADHQSSRIDEVEALTIESNARTI